MAETLASPQIEDRCDRTVEQSSERTDAEPARLPITVIVLAFNEEIHLERCLANVADWAARLVVIDSFSADRTLEIAQRFGAQIYQRRFKNQADQFQWALDHCEIVTEWIFRLDADEYLEEALKAEIREQLPTLPPDVTGVIIKRKVFFRDHWIRYGGYYPTSFLRLWRNGAARVEQRWMDEHAVLMQGRSVMMRHDFVDRNLRDITWWVDKHNRYATRQMVDFINREYPLFKSDEPARPTGGDAATRRRRALRNRVFGNAPLYLRSVLYFLYRYIVRLGFLDGKQGFVFHSMHGLWYFVLMDAKIDEAREYIRQHGLDAFRRHLVQHHQVEI